ncbi:MULTISPECIES: hypothetical protein [Paenibacillus]|uniref:YolD-like protein n=1 Tax=Paenibacillus albilobatus TaxID=2716884 RepID=A0A919XDM3_9BACL|nr:MULTISPECIES: hypothetical protein [Paenibacillus]GIO30771.1 hypothetical protein J2TS6_19120 [Paenibacillus albilobatus]
MKTNEAMPTLAEDILHLLIEAHKTREPINLRMYDEYDGAHVIGVIERIDTGGRRFMVDGEWFRASDVLVF